MRSKVSDNVPWFDKGPVEWIPRPVRLPWSTVDDVRNWMMRETLDGHTAEFHKIRELHREWSQHPKRPVLGDLEPKFPSFLYKRNHRAKSKFIYRWQKANSPNHWLWMPRDAAHQTLHRKLPAEFPENWKAMRDADLQVESLR